MKLVAHIKALWTEEIVTTAPHEKKRREDLYFSVQGLETFWSGLQELKSRADIAQDLLDEAYSAQEEAE